MHSLVPYLCYWWVQLGQWNRKTHSKSSGQLTETVGVIFKWLFFFYDTENIWGYSSVVILNNISSWLGLGQFRHHIFHTFWKENPNFGKNAKRVGKNVLSCHNERFIWKFIPSERGISLVEEHRSQTWQILDPKSVTFHTKSGKIFVNHPVK